MTSSTMVCHLPSASPSPAAMSRYVTCMNTTIAISSSHIRQSKIKTKKNNKGHRELRNPLRDNTAFDPDDDELGTQVAVYIECIVEREKEVIFSREKQSGH